MKKYIVLLIICYLSTLYSLAQVPKWMDKAKHSVFSVITYDTDDKILNTGNGFFVSENGIAVSDYSLFKGAQRAVIIDAGGKQMPVDAILGLNTMYDVIKFRVKTDKKVSALSIAGIPPIVDSDVYLLPYSTQKDRSFTVGKIKEIAKIGDNYQYYTLAMPLKDKMVSCPVVTAEGKVFGLAQKSFGQDTITICYATEASFALSLAMNALSLGDVALKNIKIKKGLPDTEEQALVFLFIASSQCTPEEYAAILDDFIAQYPNNIDGYIRRATHYVSISTDKATIDKAAQDMEQALKMAQNKNEIYYTKAKLIYNYQLHNPQKTYKDWTYDLAITEVHRALALDSLPVYMQLEGDIHFARGDYDAAFTCYEKVTHTNFASPEVFYNAAKAKESAQGDINEVIILLDSCIVRCPQPIDALHAPYLLERAQAKMNVEQYSQAVSDYDVYYDAVDGSVNDVFYYYREQAAMKTKLFQRALDDIHKAIELNPEDVNYHAELAVIYLRLGHYEEAVGALNKALVIDSKYAEAYRLMGLCHLQLKQKNEACADFTKAKELGDTLVDALIKKYCE
ncbi:Lipopolysaccharide assembly protein B [termite gut metagenome]|uniref:Lipopolysaccharide assembly protein B n=1 Tax=termite gut metagenome TaxID=433724 RepID=A0A5J4QQ24_9ZZZZ